MSEDFKDKLKDYAEGRLSEEEKAIMEEELQKLELYQEFLDEQLDLKESDRINDKSQLLKNTDKIIKKSKWKARFQNGFIALALLFVFLMVMQVLSDKYYEAGNPSKAEIYKNAMTLALETTNPNVELNGGMSNTGLFSQTIGVTYSKKIGKQEFGNGQFSLKFNFSKPTVAANVNPSSLRNAASFKNPRFIANGSDVTKVKASQLSKLEKLPEGTVAEAYITFDKLYETDEVFQKFKNMDLDLLWLAVDTGLDQGPPDIFEPLGFQHYVFAPRMDEKRDAPHPITIDRFIGGKQRDENFIKTLQFLNKYKAITRIAAPMTNIQSALDYVNKNGVKIYGATVTGPTKEILKLKDDNFVSDINVGEVQLWNWN